MSDWHTIFNERGFLLAFFGALGGAVRSAALKTTWREGLRVMFIGSSTAFGVGVLAPFLLRPWIGDLPQGMAGALGTLCAAAFLLGLMAVTLIERMAAGKSVGPESGSDAE
jgi:drug/metabolite transporter (DMT)-like permease